jgi:hypothetical protein
MHYIWRRENTTILFHSFSNAIKTKKKTVKVAVKWYCPFQNIESFAIPYRGNGNYCKSYLQDDWGELQVLLPKGDFKNSYLSGLCGIPLYLTPGMWSSDMIHRELMNHPLAVKDRIAKILTPMCVTIIDKHRRWKTWNRQNIYGSEMSSMDNTSVS